MRKPSAAPAPYLTNVIEGYSEKLAQTGAGIGQAVLWLSVVLDLQDDQADTLNAVRVHLRIAQEDLAKAQEHLNEALDRLAKETRS